MSTNFNKEVKQRNIIEMKKGIIYLFMMTVSLVLFTSCGGGGDSPNPGPDPEDDYALTVAGAYPGKLKITLASGLELAEQDNKVTLARTDVNKISLKLNSFQIKVPVSASVQDKEYELRSIEDETVVIGEVNASGMDVTKSGSNYTLASQTVPVDITRNGKTEKVNAAVTEGKVSGKTLTMNVALPLSDGTVKVVFTGTKQ